MIWKMLLVIVFLVGSVSASSVTCVIMDEKVLVEVVLSDDANVILPEEYSLLEEKNGSVSFISRDFLRKNGEWIFVLPRVVDSVYDLEVYLPQNYVLVNDLIYPKNYDISSDGKNIILNWKNIGEEVIVFYDGAEDSYFWFWVVIFSLVVLGGGFRYFERKKFFDKLEKVKKEARIKSKVSKESLIGRNLFGEEKRIVEFLMKRKSCWMKELVRELGISKVMASRKVRSLVEKGILKKESFGKENKLSLRGNR